MPTALRTVLIVEDTFSNGKLLEAKLLNAGFGVNIAVDGGEALDWLDRRAFDIVLLDVMLPGMDGFEVCRRIRGHRTAAGVPVIMITALDLPSAREAGRIAGADDFFLKPVEDSQLFPRIAVLIGGARGAQARRAAARA
jgi:two-component system cell cycle response regulator